MPIRVLIVDSSKYTAKILEVKLKALNWEIYSVHEANDCLAVVQKTKPNVILMDPNIKGVDGLVLCVRMQKYAEKLTGKPPTIVFHTRRNTREDIFAALKLKVADYVLKPASTETIIYKLQQLLEKIGVDSGDVAGVIESFFKPSMKPEERLELLMRHAKEVKAIPFTVTRTLRITSDPVTGAKDLAQVIESDTAVTTSVLRRANSAQYGADKRIVDIKEAIVRVGFAETKKLVMGLSVIETFGRHEHSLGFTRVGFWEHSLAVGLFAAHFARQNRVCEESYAFVGGLLHDVGKLVFDEHASNDFEKAIERAAQNGVTLCRAEREVIKVTHNEVGEALMRQWQFPVELLRIALHHNTPREIDTVVEEQNKSLCRLVNFCNDLAKAYRLGGAGDEILQDVDKDLLKTLGICGRLDPALPGDVLREIDSFKHFLNMPKDEEALSDGASVDMPKKLFFWQSSPLDINLFELYLVRNGYDVELVSNLEEVVRRCNENGELGQLVLDAANDCDLEALLSQITPLSTDIPVVFLGVAEMAGRFNEQCKREHAQALSKPLDGRILLKALRELLAASVSPKKGDS